jgi:hypothetical protein
VILMRTLPTLYLALALTGLAIAPAAAETPAEEAARHETARIAGEVGLKLYSSTRWEEAFEAFQRAETAFHAPTLVLFMGHCQRMRGKLVEARALYQQVASEALEPGAPNQFLTAQLLARGEIERLRRRIPAVVFTVKGARGDLVQMTVDEAPLAISTGTPQEVNPGEHALTATAPGSAPIHRTVTLAEGATAEIELAFEPQAVPPTPTPTPTPPTPPTLVEATSAPAPPDAPALPPALPPTSPSLFQSVPTSAFLAFGVGAVGLGAGAVTGVIALDQAGDLKARCSRLDHCPASDRARADAAGRLADTSTVTLTLGGAALITGVVLWLVLPPGEAARRSVASPVRVDLGPGILSVKGAF